MHPLRTFLLAAFTALLTAPTAAQAITVKDLIGASTCRDLPCFARSATQKGYVAADSLDEGGATTVIFLPADAAADELTPELGITLPPRQAGPDAVPTFHIACYDEATFQRLLKELTAMGFSAEGEPYEVGPGMMMTDYLPQEALDLSAWTLRGELEIEGGTVTYFKLGIVNLK